jgi:hypothetical protein
VRNFDEAGQRSLIAGGSGVDERAATGMTMVLSGGAHTHRRISWVAIFGGVIVVVAVLMLSSPSLASSSSGDC